MNMPYSCGKEFLIEYYKEPRTSGNFICPKREPLNDENEKGAESKWNSEADQYNQWSELGQDERDELVAEFAAMNKEGQP